MEKYVITYFTFTFEGGVVKISDKCFIWGRCQADKEIVYKEIPSNMRLITRNPQGYIEEVEIVELPYIHDSGEFTWMLIMMRVRAMMMIVIAIMMMMILSAAPQPLYGHQL